MKTERTQVRSVFMCDLDIIDFSTISPYCDK